MAKIGDGHAAAWLRSGFREAASVLPAFPQGQQIQEDPGLFGNATSREAYEQKNPEMDALRQKTADRINGGDGRETPEPPGQKIDHSPQM